MLLDIILYTKDKHCINIHRLMSNIHCALHHGSIHPSTQRNKDNTKGLTKFQRVDRVQTSLRDKHRQSRIKTLKPS